MTPVVLISANAEWQAVKEILQPNRVEPTPLGETFIVRLDAGTRGSGVYDTGIRFFHGGWGKISAAATAQAAIDCWHPDLLVNLGTCGGFKGRIERGAILLVEKTIVYDIVEQMGDPDEAISDYSTELDLGWLGSGLPHPVQRGLLLSADRDILAVDVPGLVEKYSAVAADWESGAIAWVAHRNGTRCLILRGVTDLVGPDGGEAYGNLAMFQENTRRIMGTLLDQLPDWLALADSRKSPRA